MPFIYDDGDQFSVYVTQTRNKKWVLSDDGDVLKRASELGFDPEKAANQERLKTLIDFYGVTDRKGALNITVTDDELVDSLFMLTQTCLEATWLAKTPKVPTKAEREQFPLKFERLISEALPTITIEHNWHDRELDPERIYPVDARIGGKTKQLFLFGVQNQASCMRATITCQHYRIAGADFRAVAIYDHEEQLPVRYAKQLNEVVDKRFPRIGERAQIIRYLKASAA
jgi:hypothetical protein